MVTNTNIPAKIEINGKTYIVDLNHECPYNSNNPTHLAAFDEENELVIIDWYLEKVVEKIPIVYIGRPDLTSVIADYTWNNIVPETYHCPHLKRIAIEEGITSIGAGAFRDWKSLELVMLPQSVVTVDHAAFSGCNNLRWIISTRYDGKIEWQRADGYEFSNDDYVEILVEHPIEEIVCAISRCGLWKSLTSDQWVKLLISQPQFVDKCSMWSSFNGYDWVELLRNRPEFSKYCDRFDGWRKIDISFLTDPEYFYDCEYDELSMHGSILTENGIVSVISQIENNGKTTYRTVDNNIVIANEEVVPCGRWTELLEKQPQFSDRCDTFKGWEIFDGFDWGRLITKQPSFISKCEALNGWERMREFRPISSLDSEELWHPENTTNYETFDREKYLPAMVCNRGVNLFRWTHKLSRESVATILQSLSKVFWINALLQSMKRTILMAAKYDVHEIWDTITICEWQAVINNAYTWSELVDIITSTEDTSCEKSYKPFWLALQKACPDYLNKVAKWADHDED